MERKFRTPTPIESEPLLDSEETLYGEKPSEIAQRVKKKLQAITNLGKEVHEVIVIPDHHTVMSDGGVKNILFLTRPSTEDTRVEWETTTVVGDSDTMYGWKTEEIRLALDKALGELQSVGCEIGHVIPLIDQHELSFLQGIGGFDGLKNFVICYYKR